MEANITQDSLSPFERYQLERYGNVVNSSRPLQIFWSGADSSSTAEEAFIFNNENPNT